MATLELLPSLEPRVYELLARHKDASSRIDWSYGEFLPLEAYHAGTLSRTPLSDIAYLAVETALLTEANLPWYTAVLYDGLKTSLAPLQEFVHVWTAEEDQHSMLLESYLLITDNGDHKERSKRRKQVVEHGFSHGLQGPFEAMVYTTIQELATKAFYLHAAKFCEPEEADLARALGRIAKDETRHYAFYRDVVKAHLEAEPDYVLPLADVLVKFQMPGHIIDDFAERSEVLAERQVFGPEQFYQDVLEVLWNYWELGKLAPSSEAGRLALRRIRAYRAALRTLSRRLARVS